MADLLLYLGVVVANAALLIWIGRWRSWVSFEGLGCALLLVVIGSDVIGLVIAYLLAADPVNVILEFRARAYPTVVHAVGLVALAAGLAAADPKPAPVARDLDGVPAQRLAAFGRLLILLGLGMKAVSMYVAGVRSIGQYLTQLYYFTVYQASLGGFLDKGPSIANLGLALIAATRGPKLSRQAPFVLAMGAVSFALSTSRADLLNSLLVYVVVSGVLNRAMVRSVFERRARLVLVGAALAFLVVVNAGVKSQLRVRSDTEDQASTVFSLAGVLTQGQNLFQARFSGEGLYDGYVNLVNRLSDSPGRFFDGSVLSYTATAWVPYVVYRNKPQHPFRDTGELVYDDEHSLIEDVSAPTLVGSAYADYGVASVIAYLFLYGAILGVIRRAFARPAGHTLAFVWYLHFMVVDGATNMIHGGITTIIDAAALATGVLLVIVVGSQFLPATPPAVSVPEAVPA